jgi:hypothetical protein
MTIKNIEEYLNLLRLEMKSSDPAILQDALSDAEDHLFSALESARADQPKLSEVDALDPIISAYGSPEETADAYREIEARVLPTLAATIDTTGKPFLARFFGIYSDPKAWGSLLYLLISLLTGTIYFSWAVVGTTTSLAFALFIFGLPLAAFFLLSSRGLALVEGRIVEALLGERMPRRPLFTNKELSWQERLKAGLTDSHTWKLLLYMLLQLPLGILYFTLTVILISFSVAFFIAPFTQLILNMPVFTLQNGPFYITGLWLPVVSASGFLLMTLTMHLAKLIGRGHSAYAKKVLISE